MGIVTYKADVLIDRRFLLAEGPVYIKQKNTLLFVDINADTLYLYDCGTGELNDIRAGQHMGAAIPAKSGKYLVALTTGLYLMDEKGIRLICRPKELTANLRINDAKCDPSGRFLFGTCPLFYDTFEPGSLFSLDPSGEYKKLDVTPVISNGMAWSADGKTMYYNDSDTHGVDAFDYNIENGSITNRRRIYTTEHHPDGMAIDSENKLWVALWGGYKVVRIDPANGGIIGEVPIPAENVSSCCFGGGDYKTLFITTSGEWDDKNAGGGKIYAAKVDVSGTEAVMFDDGFWIGR
jgi:sugar lactone lactonase YvrE